MNLTTKGRRNQAAYLKRQAETRIDKAYRARCSGVEINIMDIGKVFNEGNRAIAEGVDDTVLGDRIAAFVETIRKN
jgi:hypothetical protein